MRARPSGLLSLTRFASANRTRSSTKTTKAAPTHYETLEIDPGATQSEIKSAYFKLSKQYHPDKNRNEAATVKFRDITEAYEVLGSYATRRTYDRSILTRTQYHVRPTSDKPQDPKVQYYQSQAALFRQNTTTGSTPSYDFDAWTRAHYGRTLSRNIKDRANATRKRTMREFDDPYIKGSDVSLYFFAVFLVIAIMFLGVSEKTHDLALTIRQRDQLEGTDESEKQSDHRSPLDSLPSESRH